MQTEPKFKVGDTVNFYARINNSKLYRVGEQWQIIEILTDSRKKPFYFYKLINPNGNGGVLVEERALTNVEQTNA